MKTEPFTLLIATTNPGKMIEMKALFALYARRDFQLLTPADIGLNLDVDEAGQSYRENASIKAGAFSQAARVAALADDSGLEVDALDGRPGLYSARYAGAGGILPAHGQKLSDAERRLALLDELQSYPQPWSARFCCAAAIACPDGRVQITEGDCAGRIIPRERGTGGFGYDPIFELAAPQMSGLTMAELTPDQKNRISHRAVAVRQIILQLEQMADNGLFCAG